jgi:23S rRNA pseudouridine955/2504/2580 synthase
MTASSVQLVEIDAEMAGQRLDNFLIKSLKGLPKTRVYRIIRKGEVRVNGKRTKPHAKLVAGDVVRIPPITHLPERDQAIGSFKDLGSLVLYEDNHLLVINKPAGMAVHGGSGISVGVIESLRNAMPDGNRLELVHRLDRGTSGCLMVAKRRSYLRLLQEALRHPGQIKKHYVAMCHGNWTGKETVSVNQPLLTSSPGGKERTTRVDPTGKTAATRFQLIAKGEDCSLVRASPFTGRTHQIRVHGRWLRHPLVGDTRYGDEQLDRAIGFTNRLMLHAAELQIPALGEHASVHIKAPLDDDFEAKVGRKFNLESIYIQ